MGTAWKNVKTRGGPIQILFPHVRDGFFYQPVNVYDYDSTIGSERDDIRALHNPADKITYLTGATWEMLPGSIISTSLEKGYYDQERNVFGISENAAKEQEHQTELSLYIDYILLQMKEKDVLEFEGNHCYE